MNRQPFNTIQDAIRYIDNQIEDPAIKPSPTQFPEIVQSLIDKKLMAVNADTARRFLGNVPEVQSIGMMDWVQYPATQKDSELIRVKLNSVLNQDQWDSIRSRYLAMGFHTVILDRAELNPDPKYLRDLYGQELMLYLFYHKPLNFQFQKYPVLEDGVNDGCGVIDSMKGLDAIWVSTSGDEIAEVFQDLRHKGINAPEPFGHNYDRGYKYFARRPHAHVDVDSIVTYFKLQGYDYVAVDIPCMPETQHISAAELDRPCSIYMFTKEKETTPMSTELPSPKIQSTPMSPDFWKSVAREMIQPAIVHINACLGDQTYLTRFKCVDWDVVTKQSKITIKIDQFKLPQYLFSFLQQAFIDQGWDKVVVDTVTLPDEPLVWCIVLTTKM